jgi:hypothetical protein
MRDYRWQVRCYCCLKLQTVKTIRSEFCDLCTGGSIVIWGGGAMFVLLSGGCTEWCHCNGGCLNLSFALYFMACELCI